MTTSVTVAGRKLTLGRPPVVSQAHVVACPLCDLDPLACACCGPSQTAMQRLLEADTVARFTPPWLDPEVTEAQWQRNAAATVIADCSLRHPQAPKAWRINAATLRVLPDVVFARMQRAIATKRL